MPKRIAPARLGERRVSIGNSVERLTPEQFDESAVQRDLEPLLQGRVLARGLNLVSSRNNQQLWIEYNGRDQIKYVVTDSTGVRIEPTLTVVGSTEGTKCYLCQGKPKQCYRIPCEEIVIVEEDD